MQNHQPDVKSTSPEKFARQIFYLVGPISDARSYAHPFRFAPYCFGMLRNRDVTQRLQAIKLQGQFDMLCCSCLTQALNSFSSSRFGPSQKQVFLTPNARHVSAMLNPFIANAFSAKSRR